MLFSIALLGSVSLVSAHGYVKDIIVDGIKYAAYDPRRDADPKWNAQRIFWGYNGPRGGLGPVNDVMSDDITCRFTPLVAPTIHAVARAGSNISFVWTDWFRNHPGPVLTYAGLLPNENAKPQEVSFFKIDEAAYDPKTKEWGTDWLIANGNTSTVTIPSDIKPGMYVIRHEIIALHYAFREDANAKTSGAQFYPQCINVKVTGSGTATPEGVKFPGAYNWRDPGILDNIYYTVNRYITPGPAVYKGERKAPEGPAPVASNTGILTGALGESYNSEKAKADKQWEVGVDNVVQVRPGKGGCTWEPGQDPKTANCVPTNPNLPSFAGYAQPPESPMYAGKPNWNPEWLGNDGKPFFPGKSKDGGAKIYGGKAVLKFMA